MSGMLYQSELDNVVAKVKASSHISAKPLVEGDLYAADADREAVISVLKEATLHGRISLEQFEVRVGEAIAARSFNELNAVLDRLPTKIKEPQVQLIKAKQSNLKLPQVQAKPQQQAVQQQVPQRAAPRVQTSNRSFSEEVLEAAVAGGISLFIYAIIVLMIAIVPSAQDASVVPAQSQRMEKVYIAVKEAEDELGGSPTLEAAVAKAKEDHKYLNADAGHTPDKSMEYRTGIVKNGDVYTLSTRDNEGHVHVMNVQNDQATYDHSYDGTFDAEEGKQKSLQSSADITELETDTRTASE